jgi:outer membrane scaffolding protein for murein synthesis (MipA/OmpV family)
MLKKIIILITLSSFLFSENYTLEYGVGTGVLSHPNYIGSKSQSTLIFPYPFISLKYKDFTIDKNGIRQKLFNIDGLSGKLSAGGMLPSKSTGSREGMEDFDVTFELGPTIEYMFYKQNNFNFYCALPLRGVFSTDFRNIDYVGLISDPKLALNWNINGYDFDLTTGPVFANSRYHEYYYGVSAEYVTPTRAYYKAKNGYSGYATSFGFSKRIDSSFWIGSYIKYYDLHDVVYDDSPLIESNHALFGGFSIAYIFR